jgi:hypothetical protein
VRLVPQRRAWRIVLFGAVGLIALFLLAQAVPYGRDHSNPPVAKEPAWDSTRTRALAERACFDCHSNLTRWPWYSNVAPESWLIRRDVSEGRSVLNFSEWNRPQEVDVAEISEAVDGGMPPWYYALLHAKSRLSQAEKEQLIAGLRRTLQASPPG